MNALSAPAALGLSKRALGALFLAALGLAACDDAPEEEDLVEAPPEPVLEAIAFDALNGWTTDDQSLALRAFNRSCDKITRRAEDAKIGRPDYAGLAGQWRPACEAAAATALEAAPARAFFERWFQPYRLSDAGAPDGLFTGYYEPLLHGARAPSKTYAEPIRATPDAMVRIDLGQFADDLEGRAVTGLIRGETLAPMPDRAAIDGGALDGASEPFLWVDDKVDKFFLQIQGSGVVELEDGERVRVGYASQNGHAYRAIGRDLIEMGEIAREDVSLQSIRAWLADHPERADDLMWKNPSYIFFRELDELRDGDGPLGAQNVPLEPGRSLAVDPAFTPYGAPVWLETVAPTPEGEAPVARLMIAQDTGGAIRGVVRGDVFWGAGPLAEHIAGHMKSQGRMTLLLPRALAPAS